MSGTPFRYLHHLVTVPVNAGGHDTRFILDSGIGLTLVTDHFAERLGIEAGPDTFTGPRMSGQAVTLPLATLPSLTFDSLRRTAVHVGILDTAGFPPEVTEVDGFLSLAFFGQTPFTVDYPRGVVCVGAPGRGTAVDVRIESDGLAVTAFMPLVLPSGRTIEVELDMGSNVLILNDRLAEEVGIALDDPRLRVVEGLDETGHAYTRRFGSFRGRIHPGGAPELAQDDPDVMFQAIRYDGLVGDAFLRRFAVTFDIPARRVVFA
jgi:Aspartyl protease